MRTDYGATLQLSHLESLIFYLQSFKEILVRVVS